MKNSKIFSLFLTGIAALIILSSFQGCNKDKDVEPNDEPEAERNIEQTLKENTFMLIVPFVIEAGYQNQNGKKAYIGQDGRAYSSKETVPYPFYSRGTAVVLENGVALSVRHIEPDPNILLDIEAITKFAKEATPDSSLFMSNLLREGLLHPNIIPWRQQKVSSYIVPPNSPAKPIQESINTMPAKTPEGCYAVEALFENEIRDAVLYRIQSRKTNSIADKGLQLTDFADQVMLDSLKLLSDKDIISWGYPDTEFGSQLIAPQQDFGRVTRWFDPTFEYILSDLRSIQGASGSLVLHQKTGKIIGMVSAKGNVNTNNVYVVPSPALKALYEFGIQTIKK